MPIRSFTAGETVPDSGIYQAIHRGHRATHTLVVLQGELFPVCRGCGAKVRFQLMEAVPHATHDWDFAGPNLVLVKGNKTQKKQ